MQSNIILTVGFTLALAATVVTGTSGFGAWLSCLAGGYEAQVDCEDVENYCYSNQSLTSGYTGRLKPI